MLKTAISSSTFNIPQWVVIDSLLLTIRTSTLQQHLVNSLQGGVGILHSSKEDIAYKPNKTVGLFSWVEGHDVMMILKNWQDNLQIQTMSPEGISPQQPLENVKICSSNLERHYVDKRSSLPSKQV